MASSDPPARVSPTTADDPTSELTSSFSGIVQALFSAGNAIQTWQRVVDLAVETIDGCDFAGIFVLEEDQLRTPVGTDPFVTQIDALQHQAGEGPCFDAITDGRGIYAVDLSDDSRWLRFGPRATAAGIRCVLGLCLSADASRGALGLYARYPNAFGVIDRAKGILLAVLAGAAVAAAEGRDDQERRSDALQGGLATREVIGQAQGILIERERITADQAFDILRRASQHLNLKLRDIAQALVDTGENPDTGPRRSTYDQGRGNKRPPSTGQ
jgi:putative methionine-R-sulfoxide reductase with GAF domain